MSDHPEVFHPDGFGRKFGPLPIWGWALILAGGVFVWVRFFSAPSGSAGSSAASSALPNIMTTGGYLPAATSGPAPQSPAGFTDNQSWENAALQQASAFGASPVALQGALDNYLGGGTLDPSQQTWIDKVIQTLGAAPTGTNGTPTLTGAAGSSTVAKIDASGFRPVADGNGALGFTNVNNGHTIWAPNVVEYQYLQQIASGAAHPGIPYMTEGQVTDATKLEQQLA